MLHEYKCDCGNTDTNEVLLYDGLLGYEAAICKKCGSYTDHMGTNKADLFSIELLGVTPEQLGYKYYLNFGKDNKRFFRELPPTTYFAYGSHETKAGVAFLMIWDNGTTFTPLYKLNGERVETNDSKLHGKTFLELFILNNEKYIL